MRIHYPENIENTKNANPDAESFVQQILVSRKARSARKGSLKKSDPCQPLRTLRPLRGINHLHLKPTEKVNMIESAPYRIFAGSEPN